jgi:hypothetical protein
VFIVGRGHQGDYADEYAVSDLPDMLIEVRSASIRARINDYQGATAPPIH